MKGTEDTFPAYLPTAVTSLSHIEGMIKAKANHFSKLCLLAGHALVFSWYQTMADALYANDLVKVMQLYEALDNLAHPGAHRCTYLVGGCASQQSCIQF